MQKLRYIVPTVLVALGLFALAQAQSTHTNARGQVFTVYKLSDGLGDSDSATANTLWTVPALLVSQDLDVTGVATLSDQLVAVPKTSSVSNGETITLSGVVNNVTATEAATCTIADPGTAGRIAILVNVGSMNNITVAEASNLALSTNTVVVPTNGTLTLVATATNEWKELANSKGYEAE